MANNTLTSKQAATVLSKSATAILHNKLRFLGAISKEAPDLWEGKDGFKAGDTIRIPRPAQFTVRSGRVLSVQDFVEDSVPLSITTQKGVDVDFTSAEIATDIGIKAMTKRVIEPAMSRLAAEIESDVLLSSYRKIYNLVGTPGTTPATLGVYLDANQRMDETLTPMDENRWALLNPAANAKTVDGLKGLFNSQEALAKQYKSGYMGDAAGLSFLRNNLVPVHQNGLQAGTPLVNGASQSGASLITDGWTASTTVTAGTVFTVAGVYAINPETKTQYPYLQQFVVTADATANGSGQATLAISPSITASTARQTVSAAPADNAAMTLQTGAASGLYPQNMAFHKDAVRFISLPLIKPDGVDTAAQETVDGLSVRFIRFYDGVNDKMVNRFDILYGSAVVMPEWAVRITG